MNMKKLQLATDDVLEADDIDNNEMDELSEIFSGNANADTAQAKKVVDIPIDNIYPSKHNKFEPYSGEKKQAMIDSIIENGIITPLTLRVTDEPDKYEIISGENRWRCAKEAGLETVPAYPVECSEEQAIMLLTEANLINRDVTFRERIVAYRQQYDVMKVRSGERSDLQEGGEKIDSLDILAKKYGESRTQMHRYIRIADLSDDLITAAGQKRIALDAAVKLTGLGENAQAILANYLKETTVKVKNHHADEMLKAPDNLNFTSLDDIFESEQKAYKPVTSIKTDKFSRFFDKSASASDIEEVIEKALQMYFEKIVENEAEDDYTMYDEIE